MPDISNWVFIKEAISEFVKEPEILAFHLPDMLKDKEYKENHGSKMPKIGTRVKRGPDWSWQDQDSDGPGTVIGHQQEGIQSTSVYYCQIINRAIIEHPSVYQVSNELKLY